jgi:hypothetical protein
MRTPAYLKVQMMTNCADEFLCQKTEIQPGGQPTKFTDIGKKGKRGVRLSDPLELPIMSQTDMNFTRVLTFRALSPGTKTTISVKLVSEWKHGDCFPTIRLFSPVWLINKSGLPLDYCVTFPRAMMASQYLSDRSQNEIMGYAEESLHYGSGKEEDAIHHPHIHERLPLMLMADDTNARLTVKPDLDLYLSANRVSYNWNQNLMESEEVSDFVRIGVPENLHVLLSIPLLSFLHGRRRRSSRTKKSEVMPFVGPF